MLRCPDPSCNAAVGQDMINLLASEDDKEKYARYLLRSYVEDNKKVFLNKFQSCLYCFVLLTCLSVCVDLFHYKIYAKMFYILREQDRELIENPAFCILLRLLEQLFMCYLI